MNQKKQFIWIVDDTCECEGTDCLAGSCLTPPFLPADFMDIDGVSLERGFINIEGNRPRHRMFLKIPTSVAGRVVQINVSDE